MRTPHFTSAKNCAIISIIITRIRGENEEVKAKCDIAVIGGGASGLAAAIGALEARCCNVIIAERLEKTGRKILATGNGRCNLGNRNISQDYYHGSVKNIMRIIGNAPSPEELFPDMGVLCTADEQGRIYPHSNSAASVLSALRIRCNMLGAEEICGFNATEIQPHKNGYLIHSENGDTIQCRRIIVAAGGYAAPAFGTDGSVTKLLRDMGYKTAKICPGIAPLRVSPESVKGLKGIRAKGTVSAIADGRVLKTQQGEIQFTENSLSGICVFNLAHLYSEYEGRLSVHCDLLPEMKKNKLEEYLCLVQSMRYDCTLEEFLTGIFPKNLAVYLMKNTPGRPLTDSVSNITYPEIQRIAAKIKCLEFKVTGCSSWQNAQVTCGGIHGSCVEENLQSKLHKGIYFCGEILDADGDCGGYNLQWAWASGLHAGKSCALSIEAEDSK